MARAVLPWPGSTSRQALALVGICQSGPVKEHHGNCRYFNTVRSAGQPPDGLRPVIRCAKGRRTVGTFIDE
jgi:hypothetical protein